MNEPSQRPSVDGLPELDAYLAARERGEAPSAGEAGFPSGLAGDLLALAQQTHPDPVFSARLERRLQQAAKLAERSRQANTLPGLLRALWQTITQLERKPAMKRLTSIVLAGTLVLAVLFVALQLFTNQPAPGEVALVTPSTATSAPAEVTPGAVTPGIETAEPLQTQPPVAISFTPQPLPAQAPLLPPLGQVYAPGYGGSGGGSLPQGMPLSLLVELPASPAEVPAYYRLENSPLTPEEAGQLAAAWGLDARLYLPAWMQEITPEQIQRSYYALDGMQQLSLWNDDLFFIDLAASPVYEGRQYPKTGLPPAEQALATAVQYLVERGQLAFTYQPDLSRYNYGSVSFYRLLDGLRLDTLSAEVTVNPQGQVGSAWVNREEYQPIGSYSLITAQQAWDLLLAGEPGDSLRITFYPTQDGNPQYWGRFYPAGETAHLFGRPTLLASFESGASPNIQLNNLILTGDLSALTEYLQANLGYIHVWGTVQEADGERQLLLTGWEPFDEFSGYFDGTVRRTAEGDFLELSDGRTLRLPALPEDIPTAIPLYVNGGLVGDTLEWFTLQVHLPLVLFDRAVRVGRVLRVQVPPSPVRHLVRERCDDRL